MVSYVGILRHHLKTVSSDTVWRWCLKTESCDGVLRYGGGEEEEEAEEEKQKEGECW